MKTAIVTGSYGAIGKAIAKGIGTNKNYKVVMAGSDPAKLHQAVEDVRLQTGNNKIIAGLVDLSLAINIETFANSIDEPVHVLVNNASTTSRQRLETEEGTEMQWAVNVMGYFRMMQLFTPHLSREAGSRIVNVASYWAGGLDLSDPEFKRRRYHNDTAYRQSKQAERMLTRSFAKMLYDKGITVNACHPGDVNSKLSNNLGYGGSETPVQGADTPVWLATSDELETATGKYFEHRRETYCDFMANTQFVEELYELCVQYYLRTSK